MAQNRDFAQPPSSIAATAPEELPQQALEGIQQFRRHYPMGGVIANLVKVQASDLPSPLCYIVQATVVVGGMTLASALAEATDLLQAEALAQLRALEQFGFVPTTTPAVTAVTPTTSAPFTPTTAQAPTTQAPINAPAAIETLPASEASKGQLNGTSNGLSKNGLSNGKPNGKGKPSGQSVEKPKPKPTLTDYDLTDYDLPEPKFEEPFTPSSSPASVPSSKPAAFVADWSEDLAQVEVELKRLGWTTKQESDYLQRTYGKSSRDYITDYSELMDFLSYLRALPSHFDPDQFEEPAAAAATGPVLKPAELEPAELEPDTFELTDPEPAPLATPQPETDYSAAFDESLVTLEPPLSRSEMMERTANECKRLKWTNRQGSNFLKSRYDKPTRKDLNDAELWDFLQYLQSIAPVESLVTETLPF